MYLSFFKMRTANNRCGVSFIDQYTLSILLAEQSTEILSIIKSRSTHQERRNRI